MSLNKAQEGYEYQDLLSVYFILKEILKEIDSQFIVDKKEYGQDKWDDLTIINKNGKFKKQIKYSSEESNRTFKKADIASNTTYNLSLDSLYTSWLQNPNRDSTEFRLCLAWNEPVDELKFFLSPVNAHQTFSDFPTKIFKINGAAIWKENDEPLNSWKEFKKASTFIDRNLFLEFCNQLLIEVELPKFSLNLTKPSDLENIVVTQTKNLGIGVFPNDHLYPETFILSLIAIIRRARSKGNIVTTSDIFYELNIRTDFGKIEQQFPIIREENIYRKEALEKFIEQVKDKNKVILTGEPGSGKSWFITNLQKTLKKKSIKVIRHYCYTRLDDLLQHERIRLNTFYGNLIYDIINAYPDLKESKEEKYASNLSELNKLLEKISQPTYLIVDGLDHIERIFNFRSFTDISEREIAIIENIQKLTPSPHVKIIVVSQNISKLNQFTDFEKIQIASWDEADIKQIMKKLRIKNEKLSDGKTLSMYFLEKSFGNPLYVKHLIDEVKRNPGNIEKLPLYSYNLKEYYEYLLSQLQTNTDVPQVLAGVSFSLTKKELEAITGAGNYVAESLNILHPILKQNVSQNGYIIYHESFRRFIIDELKQNEVSVEKKVFKPVIDWFDTKDFFDYRKSYRYYLPFLFESGEFKKMLVLLKNSFVAKSLIKGQPWELIEKNYRYFVKAACAIKDFSSVVLLNEIGKILSTTKENFEQAFDLYINALGKIYSFNKVSDYIEFDGEPSLPFEAGLKACYICDENNTVAPWALYMALLKKEKKIGKSIFPYSLRGFLVVKDEKRIDKIAERIIRHSLNDLAEEFKVEFKKYPNADFTNYISNKYPNIKTLLNGVNELPSYSKEELIQIADKILEFEHMFTTEAPVVENFILGLQHYQNDNAFIEELIKKFKGKNWFYNWLIYYLKIILLKPVSEVSYYRVKEAFDYLHYNTKPFQGKPRACDLYSVHHIIYESFQTGLGLVKTKEQWKEVIDILVKVSSETTTSLQKSQNGPLTTEALFKLLGEFISDDNLTYINSVFEELSKEKEEYHLHADIAEYNFRLASLFVAAKDKAKATTYFERGVEYALAYTMRKDLTLVDVIEGLEAISGIDSEKGLDDLKQTRVLIDSAVSHTDGKETQYFPEQWFEKFVKIDFKKAALFLLHELSNSRYDWRAEKSLTDLLCAAKGKINPVVEFYLAITFPLNDSEKFVLYCTDLHSQLQKINTSFADKLIARIFPNIQPRQNRNFSEDAGNKINEKLKSLGYEEKFFIKKETYKRRSDDKEKWYEKEIIERKEFSLMNDAELLTYFNDNDIRQNEIHNLSYLFGQYDEVNDPLKEIIQTIVSKNNRRYSEQLDFDIIFDTQNDVACYYWVCRFFYDMGGWFQRFVNQEAFLKAYNINPDKAINYLFELMPSALDIHFNFDFSANLINTLVKIGYKKDEVISMWNNLFTITSARLPFREKINWDNILANEFEMDVEEILIALLICRLKAATTERFQWVISALEFLFQNDYQKLKKPIKWFFTNRSKFLDSVTCIILQLLLEQKENGGNFYLMFKDELEAIFPSQYFLIDFIISQLLSISLPTITAPVGIVYPRIKANDYDFFIHLNKRFNPIESSGINLEKVFAKHLANFRNKYDDALELYYNRMYDTMVSNVYPSDNLLELVNTNLYRELEKWHKLEHKKVFNYSVLLDIPSINAQINSFGLRPFDLLKPYEFESSYSTIKEFENQEWIRIGHYEIALKNSDSLKQKQVKSFGGVVYSENIEDASIFPYSNYNVFPFHIWGEIIPDFELDKTVVSTMLQEDALEYYKILWLNPRLVKLLELKVKNNEYGLVAVNDNDETVLKMRTWSSDYLGDSYMSSLSNELPRYRGTDLIIRKDYFEKICEYFKEEPSYRVVATEQKLKS